MAANQNLNRMIALAISAMAVSATPVFANEIKSDLTDFEVCVANDNYEIYFELPEVYASVLMEGSLNTSNNFSPETNITLPIEVNSPTSNKVELNFDQYFHSFLVELNKHPEYFSISKADALLAFTASARKISKISFEKYSIDLLPENAFKFVLKLSDSKLLMASQFMVDSGISKKTVVYSLYENRELIDTDILDIDSFVSKFA